MSYNHLTTEAGTCLRKYYDKKHRAIRLTKVETLIGILQPLTVLGIRYK